MSFPSISQLKKKLLLEDQIKIKDMIKQLGYSSKYEKDSEVVQIFNQAHENNFKTEINKEIILELNKFLIFLKN